jgi:hypothetical protein
MRPAERTFLVESYVPQLDGHNIEAVCHTPA